MYPELADYDIRSLAWEYDLSNELKSGIVDKMNDLFREYDSVVDEDLDSIIERVRPPAGYMYVTVEKDGDRVGFNIHQDFFK